MTSVSMIVEKPHVGRGPHAGVGRELIAKRGRHPRAELASDEHVEWCAQSQGHLEGDRNSAPGQTEHDRVIQLHRREHTSELTAGISAISEALWRRVQWRSWVHLASTRLGRGRTGSGAGSTAGEPLR